MAVTEDRLIEWIGNQKTESQWRVRQNYEPEWQWLISLYMNYLQTDMPPGAEWVNNEMLSDGFRMIETLVPQQIIAKYQNPNFFSVEAPTFPGENYEWMVKELLNIATRKARYVERSIPAIRMNQILGHAIQQTYWLVEFGNVQRRQRIVEQNAVGEPVEQDLRFDEEIPIFNGPWIEWLDLMEVWKSPECDRFGDPVWWLKTRDVTIDALEAENEPYRRVGGLYDEGSLKRLRNTTSLRPMGQSGRPKNPFELAGFGDGGIFDQNNLQEWISNISKAQRRPSNAVVVWEFWGYVPPNVRTYEDTQWRLVELANGQEMLRDVAAPTPDRKPPFKDLYAVQVGKEAYGRSPLRWAGGEIEQRSVLRNLRLAEVIMQMFGTNVIDMDVDWETFDFINVPGGYWPGHFSGDDVRKSVMPIQKHPVLQDAYIEDQLLDQHVQNTMGAQIPFQGGFSSKRMQATEFQGTVALGGARHQLQVMLNDMQSTHDFLTKAFKLYQLNLADEEIIQLRENQNVRGPIDFRDIQEPVDIYLHSGELGSLDQQKLQGLIQLLGAFQQNPETAIAIKPQQIVRDSFYLSGFPRADKYVRTEEEVAQIQQQQKQAAQEQMVLEAALEGANNGGGGGDAG